MADTFLPVAVFSNYVEAHIILGKLESENIRAWLKDENTITVNPLWTQALGGIKLMVHTAQIDRAKEILLSLEGDDV